MKVLAKTFLSYEYLKPLLRQPPQRTGGIAEANGAIVGVMIDGARIVTSGLPHFAKHGTRLSSSLAHVGMTRGIPQWLFVGTNAKARTIIFDECLRFNTCISAGLSWT